MSARISVTLKREWFASMDNTTPVSVTLTEKQAQLLVSVSFMLKSRRLWDSMTDAQWDELQAVVADAIEEVAIP